MTFTGKFAYLAGCRSIVLNVLYFFSVTLLTILYYIDLGSNVYGYSKKQQNILTKTTF